MRVMVSHALLLCVCIAWFKIGYAMEVPGNDTLIPGEPQMSQPLETTWDPTIVNKSSRTKRVISSQYDGRTIGHCAPNYFYCGHLLAEWGYSNTEPNHLYKCDSHRRGLYYASCNTCLGYRSQSYCACTQASVCGFELRGHNFDFFGFLRLDDHTLYQCTNQSYATANLTCLHKCKGSGNGTSYCDETGPSSCTPGVHYCGYQLAALKHNRIGKHALYECLADGNAKMIRTCFSGCVASRNSSCEARRGMERVALPRGGPLPPPVDSWDADNGDN